YSSNVQCRVASDVLIPDPGKPIACSISCKMGSQLNRVLKKDGRVTMELSNSSKKFKDFLNAKGIPSSEYRQRPRDVGIGIVEAIESWKSAVSVANGGTIDIEKSSYLVLLYNSAGFYQMFRFRIQLPDPRGISWYYPQRTRDGQRNAAGHLNGDDKDGGRQFEWYSDSGGQLKYYPLAADAVWKSPQFRLEPLSEEAKVFGLITKAESYFPQQWAQATSKKQPR
ncbi:MAG TPA: hypothetical protein VMT34_01720, partial [Aggregatilineales bacterium]|nr:hypothetical protein [Aggregatilineales bacterium]